MDLTGDKGERGHVLMRQYNTLCRYLYIYVYVEHVKAFFFFLVIYIYIWLCSDSIVYIHTQLLVLLGENSFRYMLQYVISLSSHFEVLIVVSRLSRDRRLLVHHENKC